MLWNLSLSEVDRVAELIRAAFRGVRLGNGVGLHQGDGLDDYADQGAVTKLRSEDEKEDWTRISIAELSRYFGSLSFMDGEGMRFHLPAFLLADLHQELDYDITFHLTYLNDYGRSRFALFSSAQRHAVREFLLLCMASPYCEFQHPSIETALREYWLPVL